MKDHRRSFSPSFLYNCFQTSPVGGRGDGPDKLISLRFAVKNCGTNPSQQCLLYHDQQLRIGTTVVSLRSDSTDPGPYCYRMLDIACCVTNRQDTQSTTPHAVHHTTFVRRTRPFVHALSLDPRCMRVLLSAFATAPITKIVLPIVVLALQAV